ncbi:MAG: hypothetical protein WCJ35_26180 [Planctomycetota bacterium]
MSKKYQLIRDRVGGVATGRHTGFFLGGRGGIGKSTIIENELRQREIPFILTNSHLTGRGLVDRLYDYPDSIHVIEDVEEAVRDPQAMGVLKSALWGTRRNREGRLERWVTWNAHGVAIEFLFCGGICMTSNLDLRSLPRLAALKTRISWMDLRVTDAEVAAKMREISLRGYPTNDNLLELSQCLEVVEFIIDESAKINRNLDLRLMVNSLEDRLQAEDFEAGCSWRDLVASRIRERPSFADQPQSLDMRAKKKQEELVIAREIVGLAPDDRLKAWNEKVPPPGNSRATLYRRLRELAETDALGIGN